MSIGRDLIAAGWKQGSIFALPGIVMSWNGFEDGSPESRCVRPEESLVVVSQTCDIKNDNEARVEALVCRSSLAEARTVQLNGVRKFVVDQANGTIALAQERLLIAKTRLLSARPQNVMTPQRLDDFTRWLARRFDRPALPDRLVEQFQQPLAQSLDRLCHSTPGIAESFSRSVREVRASVPASEDPPFEMHLLLLLPEEVNAADLEALDVVVAEMRRTFDESNDIELASVELAMEAEISVAEYFAMRPLWFHQFTFRGEQVIGPAPFHGA